MQAIKKFFSAIVFCCLLSAALVSCKKGKQWVQYYKDSENALYYYDTGSIHRISHNIMSVSVWVAYPEANRLVKQSVNLMEIDCFQKKEHAVEHRTLLSDGRSIRTLSILWKIIRPGTAGEALQKNICNKTD